MSGVGVDDVPFAVVIVDRRIFAEIIELRLGSQRAERHDSARAHIGIRRRNPIRRALVERGDGKTPALGVVGYENHQRVPHKLRILLLQGVLRLVQHALQAGVAGGAVGNFHEAGSERGGLFLVPRQEHAECRFLLRRARRERDRPFVGFGLQQACGALVQLLWVHGFSSPTVTSLTCMLSQAVEISHVENLRCGGTAITSS
jgi:hypothetical protein